MRVCQKFGMKVIFKAGQSLPSVLTKVKDPLPMEKKAKMVYRIPCSCGKSYIGETREGWRPDCKNTKRPAGKGPWRNLQ